MEIAAGQKLGSRWSTAVSDGPIDKIVSQNSPRTMIERGVVSSRSTLSRRDGVGPASYLTRALAFMAEKIGKPDEDPTDVSTVPGVDSGPGRRICPIG